MSIPAQLLGYRGYKDGNNMFGIADVTLPDISFMTETIKGAGIPGEFDLPAIGLTQSLIATINWRALMDDNLKLIAPKVANYTFMGSQAVKDEITGEVEKKSITCVMKVLPKKIGLGKLDTGTLMSPSGEFEVLYLKISISAKEVIEIDKKNYIFKVDRVDYFAEVRQHMGMS